MRPRAKSAELAQFAVCCASSSVTGVEPTGTLRLPISTLVIAIGKSLAVIEQARSSIGVARRLDHLQASKRLGA